MEKFTAVQSHTEQGPDGHFICVKGTPARNGPFKLLKSGYEVAAVDTKGDQRLFSCKWWVLRAEKGEQK